MKTSYIIIGLYLALMFLSPSNSFAETARQIMQKNIERDDGDTMMAQVQISSCRTMRKGGKKVCAERPRTKMLEEVRKQYGKNGLDTRQVVMIREPSGEKGIGFLQYDYGEVGKENDQWMYFSAIGKVKRIIAGKEDEPKTGSFFGTEMNYEDIEKRRLSDYSYELLRKEVYRKRQCSVIESVPTPEYALKSNYSKIWDWIDVENDVRLKTILFDRQGRKIKQVLRLEVKKNNGIWDWRIQIVENLRTHRLTIFKKQKVAYNFEVDDEYLTLRTLTDRSFQENHLKRYRKKMK